MINLLDLIVERELFAVQSHAHWMREVEPNLANAGNLMSDDHRQKMFQVHPVLYHACPERHRDSISQGVIVLGFSENFREQEDADEGLSTYTRRRPSFSPRRRTVISHFSVEEDFYIFCLSKAKGIAAARRKWAKGDDRIDLYEVNTELFLCSFMRNAPRANVEPHPEEERPNGRMSFEARCKPVEYCPRDALGRVEEKGACFDKSNAWEHEHEVRVSLGLFGERLETRANGDVIFKTIRNAKVTMGVPRECFKRITP